MSDQSRHFAELEKRQCEIIQKLQQLYNRGEFVKAEELEKELTELRQELNKILLGESSAVQGEKSNSEDQISCQEINKSTKKK